MLGVAIVGAGIIGVGEHLPAWASCEDAEIRWVVDSDAARASAAARKYSGVRWSTSLEDPLNDTSVDVVDICIPAVQHSSAVVAALAAEKHVLVEKPAALSFADIKLMIAADHNARLKLAVAENWNFIPAIREAGVIVASGALGSLTMGVVPHENDGRLRRQLGAGVGDRDRIGFLLAAGIHSVAAFEALAGSLVSVQAVGDLGQRSEVGLPMENELVAIGASESGTVAAFTFSGVARYSDGPRFGIRLLGTKQSAVVDVSRGEVTVYNSAAQPSVRLCGTSMGFREEVRAFASCIRDDGPVEMTLRRHLRTMLSIVAMYRACNLGRSVNVSDVVEAFDRGEEVEDVIWVGQNEPASGRAGGRMHRQGKS